MEWQFDKRIVERNIQKGVVSAKDVEKRMKGLPDLADQVAAIEPEGEPSEAGKKNDEE